MKRWIFLFVLFQALDVVTTLRMLSLSEQYNLGFRELNVIVQHLGWGWGSALKAGATLFIPVASFYLERKEKSLGKAALTGGTFMTAFAVFSNTMQLLGILKNLQ